jgi:glycosyltransferase involved in cell wall biosynthesis
MLGLAEHLGEDVQSVFLTFSEGRRCRPFLAAVRRQGFEGHALRWDTPWFRSAIQEIADHLRRLRANVLCCHGYKANILGRLAARQAGVPVAAVSRGWTGEGWRIRLYEAVDRFLLRWMDRVVAVSQGQSRKVRQTGVPAGRLHVIPNAINPDRFVEPDLRYQTKLARLFRQPRTCIIGAAGRLSPEKGFHVLLDAAEQVLQWDSSMGFVLFGSGPCRADLARQIQARGLSGSFVLAGFRADLDRFIPFFDLLVLPSFTEGMPNVVLEAFAAGVPVVATAVGGTPELVEDGASGYLVPPGDSNTLADRICDALATDERLREMGLQGRQRVLEQYTFPTQARQYRRLFEELCGQAIGGKRHQESGPEKDSAEPTIPTEAAPATEHSCQR